MVIKSFNPKREGIDANLYVELPSKSNQIITETKLISTKVKYELDEMILRVSNSDDKIEMQK